MTTGTNYGWQQHYVAAILETDWSLLPKRIAEAQAAIDRRIGELRSRQLSNKGRSDGPATEQAEEKQAIADALAGIRILIREIS